MKKILSWSMYALCALIFSFVMITVIFANGEYDYPTVALIPLTAAIIWALIRANRAFDKRGEFFQRNYFKIMGIFAAVMLILQIIFGAVLEFKPAFDMSAIYDGAIEWVETGTFSSQYDYMYYFPNNLGALAFLKICFSFVSLFGIENYFMTGVVVNSVMSVAMMCVVSLIVKHLAGYSKACYALLLFAVSLPFYFIGAVFYTDALSMLFPVLTYYLYILSRESATTKKRIIYLALAGLSAAIGMLIKFTVLIMVIATVIEILMHVKYDKASLKKLAAPLAAAVAVMIAVPLIFNAVIYGSHLDKEQAEKQNTPYTHWIMMGLKGSGRYNPDDYTFTRGFDDVSERNKEIRAEIASRISERGASGMYELYSEKTAVCFGDGTYGLSDFLDDTPKNDTSLHEYVLYDGEHYSGYRLLCTSILFAIMIMMLFAAYKQVFRKNNDLTEHTAPHTAMIGMFTFLMMWETSARYFSNYVPVMIICACMGVDYLSERMTAGWQGMCAALSAGKPQPKPAAAKRKRK